MESLHISPLQRNDVATDWELARMAWWLLTTMVVILCISSSGGAQEHVFTVQDDIQMTRFNDPWPISGVSGSEVAHVSPDGKHFTIITTTGNLQTDRVTSQLLIFDADTVSAYLASNGQGLAPMPRAIAKIVSFPHREEPRPYASLIKDLRWSSDSDLVYFTGEDANGNYRLYQASVLRRDYHPLTPPWLSVTRYDTVGDTIVYTASRPSSEGAVGGLAINEDARAVTGDRLQEILFARQMTAIEPTTQMMTVMKKPFGALHSVSVPKYSVREQTFLSFSFPFALSPKGDLLIDVEPVAQIPKEWEKYTPASGYEHTRYRSDDAHLISSANLLQVKEYTLVDLRTGRRVPLVNAPNSRTLDYADKNFLFWTPDEKRVLVTNTFLPFDGTHDADRQRPCAVASVEIPSLRVQCLLLNQDSNPRQQVQEISLGDSDDEVIVKMTVGGAQMQQKYRWQKGIWQLVPPKPLGGVHEAAASKTTVELVIRQTLNDPPTLWATGKETGQSKLLWNPNPQLAHVRLSSASVYRWKDRTGYEWTAGLVMPVDYVPGRRYPLIIQMYAFNPDQFITDGLYPSAFAARPLADAGFVVLQVQEKANHSFNDAEAQEHLEGYRSAIEELSAQGLVDADKVGVIGFSWTCWYVENALIKMPRLFAAATIADGVDHSYMEYHLAEGSSKIQQQEETIIGSKPIGDGLKRWLEVAPGFHLDKVETPLRIEAINPLSLLGEWEIYSSLRMQKKAVDLIYFPKGTHIHQRPLERLESQQGDVDWFRFWLQGYEDPDPTKKEQYKRWEHLKDLRDADIPAAKNQNQTGSGQ